MRIFVYFLQKTGKLSLRLFTCPNNVTGRTPGAKLPQNFSSDSLLTIFAPLSILKLESVHLCYAVFRNLSGGDHAHYH